MKTLSRTTNHTVMNIEVKGICKGKILFANLQTFTVLMGKEVVTYYTDEMMETFGYTAAQCIEIQNYFMK